MKLDFEFICAINNNICQLCDEEFRIINENNIRSALSVLDNDYDDFNHNCARLFRSIIIAHGFQDGNKRTAVIVLKAINPPSCNDKVLEDLAVDIASGKEKDIKNIYNKLYTNINEGINKMNNELITNFLETVYNWFLGYRFNVKTLDNNTVDIKFNEVPDDDLLGLIDAIGQEYDIVDQGNNFIEVIYSVKQETTPRLDDFDDYEEPYWEYEPTQLEESIEKICPNCDAELEFEDGHYYCPVCDETKQEIYQDTEWEDWVDKHPMKDYPIEFTDDFSDGPIYEDEVIPEDI